MHFTLIIILGNKHKQTAWPYQQLTQDKVIKMKTNLYMPYKAKDLDSQQLNIAIWKLKSLNKCEWA